MEDNRCLGANASSVEDEFGFLQGTMGVFDYYESSDVKARHKWAFAETKEVIADYETAYFQATGVIIAPLMQDAWFKYLKAHMYRAVHVATI